MDLTEKVIPGLHNEILQLKSALRSASLHAEDGWGSYCHLREALEVPVCAHTINYARNLLQTHAAIAERADSLQDQVHDLEKVISSLRDERHISSPAHSLGAIHDMVKSVKSDHDDTRSILAELVSVMESTAPDPYHIGKWTRCMNALLKRLK